MLIIKSIQSRILKYIRSKENLNAPSKNSLIYSKILCFISSKVNIQFLF